MHQVVLIVSAVLGSWLGMQAVHECGHVFGAIATGGKVARVVLHPLTIARTDLEHNPHPLIAVWCGPLIGVLVPIGVWCLANVLGMEGAFVLRFFAGFCLVANGAYLMVGSVARIGDCGEMLRHGSRIWHLWLFGAITVPIGFWLWHGLGEYFGLGPSARVMSFRVTVVTLIACVVLLLIGLVVGAGR